MLQKTVTEPSVLLKEYNLSQTKIREDLLQVLMNTEVALSALEINERMETSCDRVTLYRNLKTFVEKGIAHQIFVDNHESKYVLPDRSVQSEESAGEHIHFKCMNCSVVKCLHNSPILPVALPEGFIKLESNFVIFGLCNDCSNTDK
ncbi:MAG: transcriptional repressor [Bacteroidales bacterium]|nr:transcriptional repressor [Bacteroidales bacterium]